MARHSASRSSRQPAARRALIALASAGAALAAGASAAHAEAAAPVVDVPPLRSADIGDINPQSGVNALTTSVGYATGAIAGLKPNPLAGTGTDPLNNGIGTTIADFKPLNTLALTGPIAQAPSFGAVPVVGQALGLLTPKG
ncbi:hypothetical protein [Streptomyces seoulensis]|uniref:ATP-binding protein n=1 Tax=Streptomyces seoulensis TaxID=73044 RepID=A0A4P6TYI3_STRSO|nr:hypothetical protein [Streptomyces seoulensis]QBJ92037.1 hypothetical protein D0Z67_18240 [Streptomyces seoulensis]